MEKEKVSLSQKKNFARKKKRKFHGNRFTIQSSREQEKAAVTNDIDNLPLASTSARKLRKSLSKSHNFTDLSHFCFIDLTMLKKIGGLIRCPKCNGYVKMQDKRSARQGFAHFIIINCLSCEWKYSTYTSKECSTTPKTPNATPIF